MAARDWTEKYRPKTLADVVGNSRALDELKAWADTWVDGVPEAERACILAGEPGVGKTTSAHALAADYGWGVVELNASDQRNEGVIRRIATAGAVNRGFASFGTDQEGTPGRQLIILDEADNLFGREDRGGMKAILDTIRIAKQPILLIANDYYELTRRGASLRSLAKTIKFTRVHSRSIPPAVRRMAEAEGVTLEAGVAEAIAERAGGDLRSAVNDFAAVAVGRTEVTVADVDALGHRDTTGDVWKLLGKVFYGSDLAAARKAAFDVDETPEHISLWIDENLPVFYTDQVDLVEGFSTLSRADVYLGRVRRRQQYGLWSYASTLMTGGVAVAKTTKPAGARFVFPGWLRKQSQSRAMRDVRDRTARKIGAVTHTSRRRALHDILPMVRALMQKDDAFAVRAIAEMHLEADEAAFLIDAKATSARIKKLVKQAEAHAPEQAAPELVFPQGKTAAASASRDAEAEAPSAKKAKKAAEKAPATKRGRGAKAKPDAAPAAVVDEDDDPHADGPDDVDDAADKAPAKKPGDKEKAKAQNKSLFDF